jgi:CO/xanthine dehydrogenase FAD-binding subunit
MRDFELLVAQSRSRLLGHLAEHPEGKIVAGATDFIPLVDAGKLRPKIAIDISKVHELEGIEELAGVLRLGPLTTHARAAESSLVREQATALAEASASVADPSIRGRATLGGNICTSSPAGDSLPAFLALGAELTLASATGLRRLPIKDFLVGPGKNDLRQGEFLERIDVPLSASAGSAFYKLGRRKAMAISVVNAAAWMRIEEGHIVDIRIAMGSVAPTPVRCYRAEESIRGATIIDLKRKAADGEWLSVLRKDISPIDDVRAGGAYRRQVAVSLAERAVLRALERAEAGI